jgi:hypothetical protein
MAEEKTKGQGPIDLVSDLDKKRIEKQKLIIDRHSDDIRNMMNFAGNRRVIIKALNEFGAFQDCFVADEGGYVTSYNAGKKAAGLFLMNMLLSVCPEKFLQMVEEAKAQKIQDEIEINRGED